MAERAEREMAAVRPGNGRAMQAGARGTLRADPATGCLWLEGEDGKPTMQLLLKGEYRVDFSTSPPSVLEGDAVVARADARVVVGGGFTRLEEGVKGCPVTTGPFVGYVEG